MTDIVDELGDLIATMHREGWELSDHVTPRYLEHIVENILTLRVEIKSLRAENERLLAALADIEDNWRQEMRDD